MVYVTCCFASQSHCGASIFLSAFSVRRPANNNGVFCHHATTCYFSHFRHNLMFSHLVCCLWSAVSAKWMATAENDLYVKSICGCCLRCHYVDFSHVRFGPESHSDRVRRSELIRISMLRQYYFGCNYTKSGRFEMYSHTTMPQIPIWLNVIEDFKVDKWSHTAHTLRSCEPVI